MPKHPRYIKIEVDGKVFSSLAELARFHDLNYQQVTKRYKAGWTPHEIAHGKLTAAHNAETIVCDGKRYGSIAALARAFDIPAETVRKRLRDRGWTPEEAVGIVEHSSVISNFITFRGSTYSSKNELARAYGVKTVTLHHRLRRGWSLEEALGQVPHRSKAGGARKFEFKVRPQTCSGRTFESVAALARHYRIRESTVRSRLNSGWSPEQAVGLKPGPRKKGRRIVIADKKFNTVEEAALYHDVLPSTFRNRLGMGWSPAQAAGVEPPPRSVTVGGESYESIVEAATKLKQPYSLIKSRIKLGWSLDEAFELVPREKPLYGSYSEKFFEKHPEMQTAHATLYFISIKEESTGESFHKVGITAQKIKTRFRSTRYSTHVITTIRLPLYEAWQLESRILSNFLEYKYLPEDEGFAGRTECLKLTPEGIREITKLLHRSANPGRTSRS